MTGIDRIFGYSPNYKIKKNEFSLDSSVFNLQNLHIDYTNEFLVTHKGLLSRYYLLTK